MDIKNLQGIYLILHMLNVIIYVDFFFKNGIIENNIFGLIADPPQVNVSPGKMLNISNIEEGDDVYLECKAQGNPPVKTIKWYHNVSTFFLIYISTFQEQNSLFSTGDESCLYSITSS